MGSTGDRIRVVIADDQDLIRAGLRAIVESQPDLTVVGEAESGPLAAEVAQRESADVVLMDVQMPGGDGLRGLRQVLAARPEARVVMLTMYDLDEYVFRSLREGASGFLLKTTPPDDLTAAIRSVHDGQRAFAPTVVDRLVRAYVRRPAVSDGMPEALSGLTDREVDVLRALARGLSNAEIGAELHLTGATVKTYVTRILAKLGLRDRVQAVILAYECGLAPAGAVPES